MQVLTAHSASMLDAGRQAPSALIVAPLDLAGVFGLSTVAEGIKTEPQRRELTRLGCDYAQGRRGP